MINENNVDFKCKREFFETAAKYDRIVNIAQILPLVKEDGIIKNKGKPLLYR